MSDKNVQDAQPATISSTSLKPTVSFRLTSLVTAVAFVILIAVSFYAGVVYDSSRQRHLSLTPSKVLNRHFALGMVVYVSPNSITIDNTRTGSSQLIYITKSTLISIDGSPASLSQIKAGEITLIRMANANDAAVVLVNSKFTD